MKMLGGISRADCRYVSLIHFLIIILIAILLDITLKYNI